MKPRALLVSPVPLSPTGTGLLQRGFRHLAALTRNYAVDLLIAGRHDPEALDRAMPDLAPLTETVIAAPDIGTLSPRGLALPGRVSPSRLPFLTYAREHRVDGAERLGHAAMAPPDLGAAGQLRGREYALGFFFRLRTVGVGALLHEGLGVRLERRVLDLDDIESKALLREIAVTRARIGVEQPFIARMKARRLARWETWCLENLDTVLVCSAADRAELLARVPGAAVRVVANAVSLQDTGPPVDDSGLNLLFVGNMAFPPNIDAAVHFCQDILPSLRRQVPGKLEVWLVGHGPAPEVAALAGIEGVHVTGRVESVAPCYAAAHLAVAPIRFGGGTRIKILEALAHGRAVVATTLGAEGLELEHGTDLLLADDAPGFARACAALLNDAARRERLARSGRAVVARLYADDVVAETLLAAVG